MAKTGPLSKEEKSYIEDNKKKGAEAIAKDLDRSESIVNKHITNIKDEEDDASDDTPRTLTTSEQFARNKKYGATIMTENASMKGDETRKSRVQMPDRYKNAIHIIKPNKDD